MAAIDIGAAATDRAASGAIGNETFIFAENPANDNGAITSVEFYCTGALVDCEVATFENVSGDNFTTRDSETIGAVASGSKQTFSGLDMDVETGDYIGVYASDGDFELDLSGDGFRYKDGDQIPCTNATFSSLVANRTYSLYGEGGTAGVTEKSSSDTGAGADAKASGNPIATLVKAETGSGVDAVDSLETPEAKSSSDAGSGAEGTPVQSAILAGSESGSGLEAIIARLLDALDTGGGAEASSLETEGQLKDLFASELGEGADRLVARIEMPTKGGGMKLWT